MAELHEIQAWAGPAWDELTPERRDQLAHIAGDVAERYPDPDDQPLRDAALSAAVQYWLGETSLEDAAAELIRTRQAEAAARAAARQLAILAAAEGISETRIADRLGVQRAKTLRTWLGKRHG
ncbi:hypothetical protein ACQP2U_44000 (plasmid) [Nocardia sp. CA-084685]|uniref:hypothetical protein n=1 Tax=Nocardia sp. CA-084685 TaxID=3239970 RepID=UPI003D984062